MFHSIKFDHTIIDARKYRIARVVACMRGQLWLTFETIDDANRCSSTAAADSVGGSKHSGGDGGDDVLNVKTTSSSNLSMTVRDYHPPKIRFLKFLNNPTTNCPQIFAASSLVLPPTPIKFSDPVLFFCISCCKSCGCCGSPLPLSYPCQW